VTSIFAIRTVKVGPGYENLLPRGGNYGDYPNGIQPPFLVGAYMCEFKTAYGRTLDTVDSLSRATFYSTRGSAQYAIEQADLNATFEIVEFREKK
jgi:hypothetical protein